MTVLKIIKVGFSLIKMEPVAVHSMPPQIMLWPLWALGGICPKMIVKTTGSSKIRGEQTGGRLVTSDFARKITTWNMATAMSEWIQ
jgi:hypothetical protein